MSDAIIKVENLSKKYIIGHQVESGSIVGGYPTLRDRITDGANWLKRQLVSTISGKKIPEPAAEEFWALKDVSFEVQRGDRLGIIGRNGAGKSTLLKILSRITEPTTGKITINGRVASLLEVGTGFHPELTGRENVYLNGAILGMSKTEIEKKFDEIVDFAEIEKFLDTPVKRYSSGMYVRLAFAVAAHLEPEILIVDEVLAVGDIQFQKKCLGKMQDVSKREGRTVLVVSHNLDPIQRLCNYCLLFEKGNLVLADETNKVLVDYLSNSAFKAIPNQWIDLSQIHREGSQSAYFTGIQYSSLNENIGFHPYVNGSLEFLLEIQSDSLRNVDSLAISLYNQSGFKLVNIDILALNQIVTLEKGKNIVKLRIEQLHLKPGIYILGLWLAKTMGNLNEYTIFDTSESVLEIEVFNCYPESSGRNIESDGVVAAKFSILEGNEINIK